MGILAPFGGRLVTLDELDDIVTQSNSQLRGLAKQKLPPRAKLDLGDGVVISGPHLRRLQKIVTPDNGFNEIGSGKPLTIAVEHAYVGDYPDVIWGPWSKGDVMLTSAHKPTHQTDKAPRAVHVLHPKADRNIDLEYKATRSGSRLSYYSPAVTDPGIELTIELSADKEFDEQIGTSFAKALTFASALPVFAPAAPYLIAGAVAVPLAVKAANLLARPRTFFEYSDEIGISRPGAGKSEKGALVLFPHEDETPFDGYDLRAAQVGRGDHRLYDKNGEPYRGRLPYVVITLDGTEQPKFEGFEALAMTAQLTERFFGGESTVTGILGLVSESLELYNDLHYQRAASKLTQKIKAATGEQKAKLKAEQEALKKNIQNEDLRETVK